MKTYVIGDIHGAHTALVQCLTRSSFDYENDLLITLGDIADGWPFVIDCIIELNKIKNIINIQGNHDQWYYNFLKWGAAPSIWTAQGGKATLDDYCKNIGKIGADNLISFFRNQIPYYIDNKKLFVHGGIPAGTCFPGGKFNARVDDLLWDRTLIETAMLKTVSTAYKDMQLWGDEFDEIYVGHTAIKPSSFRQYQNIWNMDTGAGWYGVLTIMDIDTKEYWTSDNVQELFPGIHGR